MGALFLGSGLDETGDRGEPITDEDFLAILNAHYEPLQFRLPPPLTWQALVDTARGLDLPDVGGAQQETYVIEGRAFALLTRPRTPPAQPDAGTSIASGTTSAPSASDAANSAST
jgi:glycogen operon protein